MKGKNLLLTGIVSAIVGILLIIFRSDLASGEIVKVAGIIFLAAGLLNTIIFLSSRDRSGRARAGAFGLVFGWVASAAAVLLGLAMLIFSTAFVSIVAFMFAILVAFSALFQIFLLLFGSRPARLSNWFFLVPTLLIGAALFIFLRDPVRISEHIVMIVAGSSLIFFGIFTIAEGSAVGQVNRMAAREGISQPKDTGYHSGKVGTDQHPATAEAVSEPPGVGKESRTEAPEHDKSTRSMEK